MTLDEKNCFDALGSPFAALRQSIRVPRSGGLSENRFLTEILQRFPTRRFSEPIIRIVIRRFWGVSLGRQAVFNFVD